MNAYFRLVRWDLFLELLRHARHFASNVPSDLVWSYLTHTDHTRVKNRQAKRDRDKIDWLEGVITRIQSSGHVLANVKIRFCSRNRPSHASIPTNQNGTMAKGR